MNLSARCSFRWRTGEHLRFLSSDSRREYQPSGRRSSRRQGTRVGEEFLRRSKTHNRVRVQGCYWVPSTWRSKLLVPGYYLRLNGLFEVKSGTEILYRPLWRGKTTLDIVRLWILSRLTNLGLVWWERLVVIQKIGRKKHVTEGKTSLKFVKLCARRNNISPMI